MTRKPAPPSGLRNGLKWRDGRPRWEPSPANRACGFAGLDLRDHSGAYMDRGAATTAADARTLWARIVREAMKDDDQGGKSRAMLRAAIDRLPATPVEPVARRQRELVADLIERGRAVLEDREPGVTDALMRSPRSVSAMIDGYFADPAAMRRIARGTQKVYFNMSKRLKARFGADRADAITTGQIRKWHEEMVTSGTMSVATANLTIGAAGAIFQWAAMQDPPWIAASPVVRLRLAAAPGRRVFWTLEEEQAFVAWCDANGYADVADAVTVCLWTGARQIDVCAADVEDLSGTAWRFVPIKTQKKGLEALPGLLPPVARRVERRRLEAQGSGVIRISRTPFLWYRAGGRRHDSDSIGDQFRVARDEAIKAGAMPAAFREKRLQDTRDTCITRLFDADVSLTRITAWTGHAASSAESILREHYVSLREAGAAQDAAKLAAWAEREGVALAG